jgi:hypothetical protein
MIVNIRLEINDPDRNRLARLNTPTQQARLATRREVADLAAGAVAALAALDDAALDTAACEVEFEHTERGPVTIHSGLHRRGPNFCELIARARREDPDALAGKSDGFVLGWSKVKYRQEFTR